MALTKFVKNVDDLSDSGGFKFRFKCDHCGDGFESQYIAAKTNLLKTALDVFGMFRPFPIGGDAAERVDRGLRGKERDVAYERAVNEAGVFFKKCTSCGQWVCPESCWNETFNLCEACAPNADETAAKTAAQISNRQARDRVNQTGDVSVKIHLCPTCGAENRSGKFCLKCGTALAPERRCSGCQSALPLAAAFCPQCGAKQ